MLRFFSILVLLFASSLHAQSLAGKWRTPVNIGSSGYEFKTGDSVVYNVANDLLRFSLYGTYVQEGSTINIRYFPLIDIRELHPLENDVLTLKLTDQKTGNAAPKRLVKVVDETDSSREMFSDANGILMIPNRTQHVLIQENENILKRYTNSKSCFSYYRGGFHLPYIRLNDKQEMSFDADTYGNKYVLFAQKKFIYKIPLDTFSSETDSIFVENYSLPLSAGKNSFYLEVIPRDSCGSFPRMIRFDVNCSTKGARRISKKHEPLIRLNQPTHFYLFSEQNKLLLKTFDDAFDLASIRENGFYTLLFGEEKIIIEKNPSGIYSDKKKIVTQAVSVGQSRP